MAQVSRESKRAGSEGVVPTRLESKRVGEQEKRRQESMSRTAGQQEGKSRKMSRYFEKRVGDYMRVSQCDRVVGLAEKVHSSKW